MGRKVRDVAIRRTRDGYKPLSIAEGAETAGHRKTQRPSSSSRWGADATRWADHGVDGKLIKLCRDHRENDHAAVVAKAQRD